MWAHVLTVGIGIWLLASPDLMGYGGSARINNQVVGAWMATFGMVAVSESMRAVRWINLALGLWLVGAPFVLDYSDERACGSITAGLVAVALASVRGTLSERFGGGWRGLWTPSEGRVAHDAGDA